MTDGRERVFLHQIVDCDGALVFDVAVARPDTVFVEEDLDEAPGFRRSHRRVILIAAERAWAPSPSPSSSAMTAGPSCANCSGPPLWIEGRFMKKRTPHPRE